MKTTLCHDQWRCSADICCVRQRDECQTTQGEVVNADQGGEKASANEIMKKLPETLPNSYVISSAGLPWNPDYLHFTAEGYRQFGKRYAEKMLARLGDKIKTEAVANFSARHRANTQIHSLTLQGETR